MTDDDRAKLRGECHADLAELRGGGELPERAFRLLERLVARLDRLETGSFPAEETPTAPTPVRKSSGAIPIPVFRADKVIAELEKGKSGSGDGEKS
jgi:hypothetical protein